MNSIKTTKPNLKKKSVNVDLTDDKPLINNSKKQKMIDSNLHVFKKKKLKKMEIDPKNQKIVDKLETLITNKNNWEEIDIRNLFIIMYDRSDIASIYGVQIEKALLEFVDKRQNVKDIQLAALCMSRFATVKNNSGTILLQSLLSSMVHFGKQYFDFFNVSSSLNDMQLSFKNSLINFTSLNVDDETIWVLINRVTFIIYSIEYLFVTNYNIGLTVPYDDVIKILIAFLSTTPNEILEFSNKPTFIKNIPIYLNLNLWKLLLNICSMDPFRGCIIDYIPNICEIIKLCLGENCPCNVTLSNVYIESILNYLLDLMKNEARYSLPTITCLLEVIVTNVDRIVSKATSNIHERVVTNYLRVFNELLSFHEDKSVEKCVCAQGATIEHMKSVLVYLEGKSIYTDSKFLKEFLNMLSSLSRFKFTKSVDMKLEENYFSVLDNTADITVQDADVMETSENTNLQMKEENYTKVQTGNYDVLVCPVEKEVETVAATVKNMEIGEEEENVESEANEEFNVEKKPMREEEISDKSNTEIDLETMLKSFVPW